MQVRSVGLILILLKEIGVQNSNMPEFKFVITDALYSKIKENKQC